MSAAVSSELELDSVSDELNFESLEFDTVPLELDAGAEPSPAVTVIVPLLEAFFVAPVVVTVNLYAPAAAVAETVPEM